MADYIDEWKKANTGESYKHWLEQRLAELEAERDRMREGIKAFVDREYAGYGAGAATGDEGFKALESLLKPPTGEEE